MKLSSTCSPGQLNHTPFRHKTWVAQYSGRVAAQCQVPAFAAVLSLSFTSFRGKQVILKLSGGRPPDRVVCIGHSLGGAVAQLAALWITDKFPQADVRMVSFGSPRVGNNAFKVWASAAGHPICSREC